MKEYEWIKEIADNISKVIIGKKDEIYSFIKGIIAGGHILIEDVPGVGKTTLVKALAKTLELSFSRIQFTPDLLPSDITGISVYNPKNGEFDFKRGPVFANIILADEINRTSPKTQSALLEVMEENQVSEGNCTYTIEKPFIVLATQNPVEHEGTFLLPEAQLDRFMIKLKLGYVDNESESEILQLCSKNELTEEIKSILRKEQLLEVQKKVKEVYVSKEISDYIVSIVSSTRKNQNITLGGSTRASIALLKIAKAHAFIEGRDYVIPSDVKVNAVSVLSHRIMLSPTGRAKGYTSENIIEEIVDKTVQPRVI